MNPSLSSGAPPPSVTIVIPTLGGPSLKSSIDALNRGSLVPAQILVCIPAAEAQRAGRLSGGNVEIVVTDGRGQVAQRAFGFRRASHEFVIQLDDDMLVDARCVERLLGTLRRLGNSVAVAPSFMDITTGKSVYQPPRGSEATLKIYHWLMNGSAGYQPGRIDKSGSAVGINPGDASDSVFDVEWLAGGCVMHYRENLVLEDFYPFPGKAYHEDVIHSHYLKRKGIRLIVDAGALCWLKPADTTEMRNLDYLRHLATDYRRRRYAMRLESRESMRIYLFYLMNYLSYWRKRLTALAGFGKRRPHG